MAMRLGISNIIFMTLVVMAMLHRSTLAQTTHVVGDALGWTFPPGGEVAYRTWAATQNFSVGDVLVFNYTTGSHDVAEVSKDSFDSCNGNNPIFLSTNGPTNITLTSSGEHHFICTFNGHCGAGMKVSINVVGSAAVSPAPSPSVTTPPPVATPAPAPAPARAAMTYTVGDSLGWTVPPGGPVAYQTWARGKSFMVGDTLVFNFTTNEHDVAQVTKAEYDSCNAARSTAIIFTGPARITLNSSGEHHYICTFRGHCPAGQKLSINVTAGGATVTTPSGQAPAPSSGATPPRSVSPSSPSTPSTTPPTTPPSGTTTAPPPSTTPSTTPPSGITTAPPPGDSSAPSLAAATLPLTFLAVAFAVLYN